MENIIIVGGGIAGLTAAIALLRQGLNVKLFEQASAFGEVGAGISLSQPASRGLFSLGLQDLIEREADIPARAGLVDYVSGEPAPGLDLVARSLQDGEVIPYFYQIHRADLHRILSDRVTALDPTAINLDRRLVALAQDSESVVATFANGSTVRGSVLLGADGIDSRVRELLFGPENPRFTGQVAYRFLVPVRDVEDYLTQGPSVKYAGNNRLLLRYIIRHGTLVNGVGFVPTDSWTGEGWVTPVSHAELLEQFADANPELLELLRRAPTDGIRKWALFDRDPLPHWTVGRVALMGDAAHPMLPFLGLGAAMGIEDGVVLGRAFASGASGCDALAIYEATRKPRANGVLLASRIQGEVDQARQKGDLDSTDNEALLQYDPATVALAA